MTKNGRIYSFLDEKSSDAIERESQENQKHDFKYDS